MDWTKVWHFKKKEFVDDADYADPTLIIKLDMARELLQERIHPSPVKGSLCRFGGSETSQHYIGPKKGEIIRLSTGVDVFIEGHPMKNFIGLMDSGLFKGIGIYLDTNGPDGKPWVMFHLDIRCIESLFYWFRTKKKYRYPLHTVAAFKYFMCPILYQIKRM